jgi:hypothetical protein
VKYIDELRDVIRQIHGVEATHVDSVAVKESFKGRTVWEGIVEVFELHGHPQSSTAYAWSHATDEPEKLRHVTVLQTGPIKTAAAAVRAAIIQEFRQRVEES